MAAYLSGVVLCSKVGRTQRPEERQLSRAFSVNRLHQGGESVNASRGFLAAPAEQAGFQEQAADEHPRAKWIDWAEMDVLAALGGSLTSTGGGSEVQQVEGTWR